MLELELAAYEVNQAFTRCAFHDADDLLWVGRSTKQADVCSVQFRGVGSQRSDVSAGNCRYRPRDES